ncbi:hypothetical protein EV424DRAFT_1568026 [Suillus variegatus]|nr:hypothetical protein EV424DRAFT_1568026 [Suillus variegatus]
MKGLLRLGLSQQCRRGTLQFLQAHSKHAKKSCWKWVVDITNDWNFPGVEVFPFLFDFAPFHLIKGLEAKSNFHLHHADCGDTSAERCYWKVATIVMMRYIDVIAGAAISLRMVLYIELIWSQSSGNYAIGIADRYRVTTVALMAMLDVVMIARLHAMYQGSRMMLMFLVIIFLAVNIACGVIMAIALKDSVKEHEQLLFSMVWILDTVWEVLALCLSVWIAVKHFRELRRLGPSTGSTIRDCFRVLIQSHVLYFSRNHESNSIGARIFYGALQILLVMQMFVLGPHLILSIQEYHAKLVAYSNAETSMNSIVFQERVHVSTSSTV